MSQIARLRILDSESGIWGFRVSAMRLLTAGFTKTSPGNLSY